MCYPTGMENITTTHCQSCGSTDIEDVGWDALRENDGYTACCNERAIYPGQNVYGGQVPCGQNDNCYHP